MLPTDADLELCSRSATTFDADAHELTYPFAIDRDALMLGGADVRMTSGVSATISIAYLR